MSLKKATRVLQVISAADVGGGQRHLLTLVEWFRSDASFELHAVCRPGGFLASKLNGMIPVATLPLGDFCDLASVWKLYKTIKAGGYDLIHAHLNRACLYASLAGKLAGVPVICTAHGMTKTIYYRFADRIIAVSDAVRAHLCEQLPSLDERIRVVHNGIKLQSQVNPAMVQQFRNAHYIKPNERIAGILGTLHENKGQEVAIRAFKTIPERYNLRLLICGDGPHRGQLEQLVKLLSLGSRVLFLPATEHPDAFLSLCDFVLVPSIREAFSLVILESLLLRKPIFASRTGGIPEILEDGVNGRLFPPGDSNALAELLMEGCDNHRRLERMASEGPSMVLNRFSHNKMGNATRSVYRELLEERRPKAPRAGAASTDSSSSPGDDA